MNMFFNIIITISSLAGDIDKPLIHSDNSDIIHSNCLKEVNSLIGHYNPTANPIYLDRERKWNIFVDRKIDYYTECEKHYENTRELCPANFENIHTDPITYIITTTSYQTIRRPITCIKKSVCKSIN